MSKTTIIKEGITTYTNKYGGDSLCSSENGVKEGEVRVIDEKLYYAGSIHKRRFSKNEVNWYLVTRRFLPINLT